MLYNKAHVYDCVIAMRTTKIDSKSLERDYDILSICTGKVKGLPWNKKNLF